MRAEDVPAADLVAFEALWGMVPRPGETLEARARRGQSRIAHLLETDPGVAWVAEADGRVVGAALALMREGLSGLSLFVVEPAWQGAGIGRDPLDDAMGYGDGGRGALILSAT